MKIVDSLLMTSCHGEVGSGNKRRGNSFFVLKWTTEQEAMTTVPTLLCFLKYGNFFPLMPSMSVELN